MDAVTQAAVLLEHVGGDRHESQVAVWDLICQAQRLKFHVSVCCAAIAQVLEQASPGILGTAANKDGQQQQWHKV